MSGGPSWPASRYVGRWLRNCTRPELGFGYCKGSRDGKLVLSYVDLPEVAEHELLVSADDLQDKPIPAGTRIWVRGTPYGWHAGVIDSVATAHRYRVSLVGDPLRLLLYQDQFVVRWAKPLENPALAVAIGLTEAPTFYDARSALLAELVLQRRVSHGLSSAISAPIKLFQHQVDTAARVLADPVMRYLLADEVGLGKTIEAGLVVRQLLIDDSATRILVLCPETLKGQWLSELRDRLGLDDALQSGALRVVPHADIGAVADLGNFDLVVVDEAHNFLRCFQSDSRIERDLQDVEGLLALSATPMRGDLETFRRLLALVDPLAFGATTAEEFRVRLDERERSAGDVQVLATRRASLRQKTSVLESVLSDFAGDANVRELAGKCRESDDPQDPSWTAVADYVREIYRLSRRMIRHRRSGELTQSYGVAGRFPTFVEIADPGRAVVDDFLEGYRRGLNGQEAAAPIFARVVLHALAGPLTLRDFLRRLLDSGGTMPHALSQDDRSLFEMTIARLEMAGLQTRIDSAAELVRARTELGRKVVVASSFPHTAKYFEVIVRGLIDERHVHTHYGAMGSEDRDGAVADFLEDDAGSVLIADSSMEEGRNLQEAEVLVNLDLPLDANRLDQRIGRLDRYAVRPGPAEVVVIAEPESEWVSAHITLLHEGIGVFDSSVSTVQRLLTSILDGLVEGLLVSGVESMRLDVFGLRDELGLERDSIDLLEELESVESATVFAEDAFNDLLDYEEHCESLRSAVKRFTTGTGSLALRPAESSDGVVHFGSARDIGLAVDEAADLQKLLRPKAYDRTTTLERPGVTPFRIGDPLVDWLEHYLVADERGRASSVVRPVPGLESPALWLHSEFLIEFDSEQSLVASGPSRRRLARRGEGHLQPLRVETWTDPSGVAPNDLVVEVLGLQFDVSRDEVLRGRIWGPVMEALPAWSRLCRESAEVAWEEVRSSRQLSQDISDATQGAEQDAARRRATLEARSLRLPLGQERAAAFEELEVEVVTADAVLSGISRPAMRLVACGVCVLWPEETF